MNEPDLKAAFLFGSAAWGDADETSDLDIMLLLDRPVGYREVTRIRLADILGQNESGGPDVADIDRIAWRSFVEEVSRGRWGLRIINSIVLFDRDTDFQRIHAQVQDSFYTPVAMEARYRRARERATTDRALARQAVEAGDDGLATLQARLAVRSAAEGLLNFSRDRGSLTHFVDSAQHSLRSLGYAEVFPQFVSALGLDSNPEDISRSVAGYHFFTDTLKKWVETTELGQRLSAEDRAWARLTYSPDVIEEITHKTEVFELSNRRISLQYYLDGKILSPIHLSLEKILPMRLGLAKVPQTIREFHILLREEPTLFDVWVSVLRLKQDRNRTRDALDVADTLVEIGDKTMESIRPG
jgi:predicted nucleotidyltransferase